MAWVALIKPSSLKVKHEWQFAWFSELKSERDDGKQYTALLIRNIKKSKFGIIELNDLNVNMTRLRAMATKLVLNEELRNSALTGT